MKKIVLLGSGGHCKVIQDIVKAGGEYELFGLLDDKETGHVVKDGIHYAPISFAHELLESDCDVRLVISIGNNRIRKKIAEKLNLPNEKYATLVHPSAVLGSNVTIGAGAVVMPGAMINADSKVGKHNIVNTRSVIEHDNLLEDYVHLSPNASAAGGVTIAEGTHVGIGASIIPGIHIEEWTVIGAGAAVVHNLPAYCTAAGVPAKPIKFHERINELHT
ncbi:acetyltransferase [Bacillus tianshenii]|nr:acetyltransferase [Bacillus tianshenii]